jgi:hypothetical protein
MLLLAQHKCGINKPLNKMDGFMEEKAQDAEWKMQRKPGGRIDLTTLSTAEWLFFFQ